VSVSAAYTSRCAKLSGHPDPLADVGRLGHSSRRYIRRRSGHRRSEDPGRRPLGRHPGSERQAHPVGVARQRFDPALVGEKRPDRGRTRSTMDPAEPRVHRRWTHRGLRSSLDDHTPRHGGACGRDRARHSHWTPRSDRRSASRSWTARCSGSRAARRLLRAADPIDRSRVERIGGTACSCAPSDPGAPALPRRPPPHRPSQTPNTMADRRASERPLRGCSSTSDATTGSTLDASRFTTREGGVSTSTPLTESAVAIRRAQGAALDRDRRRGTFALGPTWPRGPRVAPREGAGVTSERSGARDRRVLSVADPGAWLTSGPALDASTRPGSTRRCDIVGDGSQVAGASSQHRSRGPSGGCEPDVPEAPGRTELR
jgi:hypothetical protein